MGNHRGKKNQKREQSKHEVVRQRRRKRHGVILYHVAHYTHRRVLEVE
jgi:hypothetical protein